MLGEQPDVEPSLWGPVSTLLETIHWVIDPVLDFMLRGIASLKPDISGFTIGMPHSAGLPGMLGLKFGLTEKGKIGMRQTYDTALPAPAKRPFFPS